jgi:hypothetical protein
MILLPPLILASGALFSVRGYSLRSGALVIHRLGWSSYVDLAALESAVHDPDAMSRSLRLFGNGGFFAFTGWYRNRKLGVYRAFVTDPRLSVVLRFPGRVVVVTPGAPERFVRQVTSSRPAAPREP